MPPELLDEFHNDMKTIQDMYHKWRDYGLKKEDARFVLPNACTSEIVVSANFREWRHILTIRTAKSAQWEIRKAANLILDILKKQAPACFEDIVPEN
jgi:thymidylate synthase (FAD)